ncbi:MAG: DUF177 domain-containing protein [Deltaproteobacteria bacterium]|jgi:uncharacterized protein|nr:DUF177 domain-containing protein [Deltaproteobacteria bacterium]
MPAGWMPLCAALNEGAELILTDQSTWLEPMAEFGLNCRISVPLEAGISLSLQKDGLLVRGRISGSIIVPCALCAEDALITLRHRFDSFEPFPPLLLSPDKESEVEVDGYFIRWSAALAGKMAQGHGRRERAESLKLAGKTPGRGRRANESYPQDGRREAGFYAAGDLAGLEINPGHLAWEEFAQSLPQLPLCREDCAGLCPGCGHNLNHGPCACAREEDDPRLEKLRGLKLNK